MDRIYGQHHFRLVSFPVTKVTAKCIFYQVPNPDYDSIFRLPGDPDVPQFLGARVDRELLESARASRGYHNYAADKDFRDDDHLFASEQAAKAWLAWWQECFDTKTRVPFETDEALVRQLRKEAADLHPDRGGDPDAFQAAHRRYLSARARMVKAEAEIVEKTPWIVPEVATAAGVTRLDSDDLVALWKAASHSAKDDFLDYLHDLGEMDCYFSDQPVTPAVTQRLCACGCGRPVTSPRPEAKYATGACRVRVHRASQS